MKSLYLGLLIALVAHCALVTADASANQEQINHVRVPGYSIDLRRWAKMALPSPLQQHDQTSSTTSSPDDESRKATGAFVGIGIGGLVLAALVAAGVYYARRRRASRPMMVPGAHFAQAPNRSASLQQIQVSPAVAAPNAATIALPPNWEEYYDVKYNQPYYFNRMTRETVWEIPAYAFAAAK